MSASILALVLALAGLDIQNAIPAVPVVAEEWVEPCYEQAYYEPTYYEEPTYYTPTYCGDPNDFQNAGVVYEDGVTYTWYSENVLPGGGLDIPGRNVNGDGYVCDGDGNIAVASSDYEIGTQLDTPWGSATVYDTGCASGVVDVYTSW